MLFSEVVGHQEIKSVLIDSVKQDRVSHAQLLFENEGYGAFPLAVAYARYILCESKLDNDSCGICSSCLKIAQFAHPDVHFSFPIQISKTNKITVSDDLLLEWKEMLKESPYFTDADWYKKIGNENKKGIIGKDESENLLKKLQLKSYEGNYKIVIMYGAETMNSSASNKLLKLIEEPPSRTLFILISSSIELILPTIQSRVQVTKLKKPTSEEISSYFLSHGQEEQKVKDISYYVDGNIAKAYHLLKEEDASVEFFNYFVTWMRICFSRDVAKAIEFSADIASIGREKQKEFLLFSLEVFQKSLTGNFLSLDVVKVNPSHKAFMEKFRQFIVPSNVVSLHEHITDAHYHVDRNANPKILFLDLSFKLFSLIKK